MGVSSLIDTSAGAGWGRPTRSTSVIAPADAMTEQRSAPPPLGHVGFCREFVQLDEERIRLAPEESVVRALWSTARATTRVAPTSSRRGAKDRTSASIRSARETYFACRAT